MAGIKTSHLPTLTEQQIYEQRACVAFRLSEEGGLKIPNIRAVLRCGGPEEVRKLLARGERIANARLRIVSGAHRIPITFVGGSLQPAIA